MMAKLPLNALPFVRRFRKDNSGAVAVEMTLVIIPFMLLFLFVAELCSVLYVSVSIDLAMAEAMRFTSSSSEPTMANYKTNFLNKMKERITALPLMVYKESDIQFDVVYCQDSDTAANSALDRLANGNCTSTVAILPSLDADDKPIVGTGTPVAFYSIRYKYSSLFFPIPTSVLHTGMSRNGIYVMENTRVRAI